MDKKGKDRLFSLLIETVMKHSVLFILLTVLLTVFFAYQATRINFTANVFSMGGVDVDDYPYLPTPPDVPTKPLNLDGLEGIDFVPQKGEVVEIPYRDKSGMSEDPDEFISKYTPMEEHADIDYSGRNPKTRYRDGYVIIFTSKRMFDPEVLNTIYSIRKKLSERPEIGACLSPFDFVTVEKHKTRLALVPMAPVKADETWTEESAEIFQRRLLNDKVAKNYLYTGDGQTIMIYYMARWLDDQSLSELNEIVNPLRQYGRVALNGGGYINNAVMKYLNRDLVILFVLCLIVILVTFYLSFHSTRSLLLPASLSIIAIIWTMGIMAMVGYEIMLMTILTPCLVITLGSSYTMHMLSEYYQAMSQGEDEKLKEHFAKISKTIIVAMITTACGFLSFRVCQTPSFKVFGTSVAIGVAICAWLSFTYLPAILSLTRRPKKKQLRSYSSGLITRSIYRTGDIVCRSWKVMIVIFILIFAVFMYAKDHIDFDSNYMNYLPRKDEAVKDTLYFARTLGSTNVYEFNIRAPEGETGYFYRPEVLKDVYAFECAIQAADPDIVSILSFTQYVSFLNYVYSGEEGIPDKAGMINYLSKTLTQIKNQTDTGILNAVMNEDGTQMRLSLRNYDAKAGDLQTAGSAKRIEKTLNYYRYLLPADCSGQIASGASSAMRAMDVMIDDQMMATWLSIAIIFLIVAFTLKSIPYGALALIPVCTGIMVNYIFMCFFHIQFDIVTIGFSSIAVGAGVDDAIHFLLRFIRNRKEREGMDVVEQVRLNIRETGRAIFLTTLSIDCGMVMLAFASFNPIKYFGLLMIVSLSASMIATLCILPAVIILKENVHQRLIRNKA